MFTIPVCSSLVIAPEGHASIHFAFLQCWQGMTRWLVEINRYKTLAAQKQSQQKFEQDLNYLVAKTKRDFQDGDYTSCMYNSKTALSKIESLGAKQRKRYAAIQREMVAYKSKAVTAIQIRQRQLAVLQKIKKNIAEDNLEEANSLVDAMLVQPTNLSPDVHEALLSYREKIKKRMKEN